MARKYVAVYQRIKDDIYHKYPVGSLLPTERDLMDIYGASRTTIRHAIAMLREERLLDVRQGRGTQVLLQRYSYTSKNNFALFHNVSGIDANILSEGAETYETHGGIIDIIPATEFIAKQLGVAIGSLVYRLERILCVSDQPLAYFKSYYRCALVPGLEQYSGQETVVHNMYRLLEEKYGVFFEAGEECISAQLSGYLDSKLLDMKPNLPLLMHRRIAYTRDRETLEYCERLIRPDKISIVVSMSGSPRYS